MIAPTVQDFLADGLPHSPGRPAVVERHELALRAIPKFDRERHKARIAAKNLRYAGEFFTSLYEGKRATRRRKTFLDALETLQDDLGDLNDRVTAPSVFKRLGLDKLDVANAATDFGPVKKLLGQAEEDYNILSKVKRFWK